MAAVTKVDIGLVSPPGYEVVKRGLATVALAKGDPVVYDAAAAPGNRFDNIAFKKAASETFINGVVLKDTKAGQAVEVLQYGELDGFSGLTPGAKLSVASGAIDNTAPSGTNPIQLVACSPTRITVFNCA